MVNCPSKLVQDSCGESTSNWRRKADGRNKQKRRTEIHPEANSDEDQPKEVDKDLESHIDVL